ncbi:MAG: hypothetical protein H6636_10785 [Anaerolineales bacterium]|nr:hypothetical protein [Anaerolineales bacterium]
MIERLFVYGTLGPGRLNEHILTQIGGSWEAASVTGTLRQDGWGAAMGYPGIDLDENGDEIHGFVFSSIIASPLSRLPTPTRILITSLASIVKACTVSTSASVKRPL